MELSRGTALALLGVGLFVAAMAVGAATAPDRNVGDPAGPATPTVDPTDTPDPSAGPGSDSPAADGTDTAGPAETATPPPDRPQTLVGVQGGWTTDGLVLGLDGHDTSWTETSADGYFEVSQMDDGRLLAAFANESETGDCGDYASPCDRTGFRIIDPDGDDGPEIDYEHSFPVRSLTNSEVHAVDQIGEGEYVFVDMDQERIAVVENDTEVWEWRAEEFYDAPDDPTRRDWLHMNDVDAIGDDRFLVSIRNANQILIVERGEGVVEVINEDRDDSNDDACTADSRLEDSDGDGDVRCGDPSVIKEQHNPQWIDDGAVLVADSENDRVIELHRNESGVWERAWIVREANGLELNWPRDADRLPNGNTLITDSLNKRVIEVDSEGRSVWTADIEQRTGGPDIPYEADRLPFGEITGRYDGSGTATPIATETTDGDDGTAEGPSTATDAPSETRTPLPRLTADDPSELNETGSDIPGLSIAITGLRGTVSWLPIWFREFHLGVTIVSLLFVLGGGIDRWRNGDATVSLDGVRQ